MELMISLLALGCWAAAAPSLPVHPGGIGGLYKGPNSETIIKGPDGSVITAAAEGGAVLTNLEPIVVAEPAAISVTPPPVLVETVELDAPRAHLEGPSGTISTHGSQSVVAGPASTTITGPAVAAETLLKGPPVLASPGPIVTVNGAPLATISDAAISAVTAAPILTVTGLPLVTGPSLVTGPTLTGSPTVTALNGAPIATAIASNGNGFASSSTNPQLSSATASSSSSAIATATAAAHGASAFVGTLPVSSPVAIATGPFVSSTVSPLATLGPAITSPDFVTVNDQIQLGQLNPDQAVQLGINPAPLPAISSTLGPAINHGLVTINDQIQLGQLNPAVLGVNPALTPAADIAPPQIGLGPIAGITERTVTVSPGPPALRPNSLGVITPISNIQRAEGVNHGGRVGLLGPQGLLVNNDITGLDPQLRNEAILAQNGGPRYLQQGPVVAVTSKIGPTLASVQEQEILSAQLAKAGIGAGQVQYAEVPLGNPAGLRGGVNVNDLLGDWWGRYGRRTEEKKN